MRKRIHTTKQFLKHLQERTRGNPRLQKRVKERIELFQVDKSNPLLRDHGLKGTMYPMRSFSITGDLRIIYEEVEFQGDKLVIFIDIGTHNQVY